MIHLYTPGLHVSNDSESLERFAYTHTPNNALFVNLRDKLPPLHGPSFPINGTLEKTLLE